VNVKMSIKNREKGQNPQPRNLSKRTIS